MILNMTELFNSSKDKLYSILEDRLKNEKIDYEKKDEYISILNDCITLRFITESLTEMNNNIVVKAHIVNKAINKECKFFVNLDAILAEIHFSLDSTIGKIKYNIKKVEEFNKMNEQLEVLKKEFNLTEDITHCKTQLRVFYIGEDSEIDYIWKSDDGRISIAKIKNMPCIHVVVKRSMFTAHSDYLIDRRSTDYIIDDIRRLIEAVETSNNIYYTR